MSLSLKHWDWVPPGAGPSLSLSFAEPQCRMDCYHLPLGSCLHMCMAANPQQTLSDSGFSTYTTFDLSHPLGNLFQLEDSQ